MQTNTHVHTRACAQCPHPPVPVLLPSPSHWCHPSTACGCSSGSVGLAPTTAKAQGWAHWEGKESQCQIRIVRKLSWGQRGGKASFPPTELSVLCWQDVAPRNSPSHREVEARWKPVSTLFCQHVPKPRFWLCPWQPPSHAVGLRGGCGVSGGKTALALLCSDVSAPPGRAQLSALTQRQGPSGPRGALQGGAGKVLMDTCLLSSTEEHLGILEG